MKKKVSKKTTKMKKTSSQLNLKNTTSKVFPPLKKISSEEIKKLNFAEFKFPAMHSIEKKEKKSVLKQILRRKK